MGHDELVALVEELWSAPVHERRMTAVELLALLLPRRRGDGDFERFSRYADAKLDERGFFVRKAIGWVLRDMARKRPALVYDCLLPRARRASGVTLPEAVKPLSGEQRAAVLAAR